MVLEFARRETVRSKGSVFNGEEFIEVRQTRASDAKISMGSSCHLLYRFRLRSYADTNEATSILYFLILL